MGFSLTPEVIEVFQGFDSYDLVSLDIMTARSSTCLHSDISERSELSVYVFPDLVLSGYLISSYLTLAY